MTACAALEPLQIHPSPAARSNLPLAATRRRADLSIDPEIARDLVLMVTLAASAILAFGALHAGGRDIPMTTASFETLTALQVTSVMALSVLLVICRPQFSFFRPRGDAWRIAGLAGLSSCVGAAGLAAFNGTLEVWAAYLALSASTAAAAATIRLCLGWALAAGGANHAARNRVAVFGAGPVADRLAREAAHPESEFKVVGVFDDRLDVVRRRTMASPICGTSEDLEQLVKKGGVDEVVVALPLTAKGRIGSIIERLSCNALHISCPVPIAEAADRAAEDGRIVRIGDLVLLRLYSRPIEGWAAIGKNLFDRGTALLALLILSPVLAIIAATIKLDSRGPVFFRQARHGLSGRIISVWKFRSMRTLEDGEAVKQVEKHDARITRVGAFLRKTSLDELPQLLNVVLGEMSLVGPRPHAVAHNLYYEKLIDGYNRRQRVKPGITGLAQIRGFRGETKDPSLMQARIEQDLDYIRRWSPLLDLKILLLTPSRGLVHPNAY